ncbi:MAG: T9SS type A sorting domain-containing protein [Bacteroidota bacterium]|nr:T9SS type A sorting domain-containing protein [Bacteroidota bacterium]
MNTKYYLSLLVAVMITTFSQAQTMRWILAPSGSEYGSCPNGQGKQKSITYVLEYTPGASGVLTSYTTGFLVSCTSVGSAVIKNQSRVMNSKNHETSGCNSAGVVLMNSSGNSGTFAANQVLKEVPIILHQICISLPEGETLTLAEDEVTDLTTSLDLADGSNINEFPAYTTTTIGKIRYDVGVTLILLDFQAVPAGDLISQLDWSMQSQQEPNFVVERSFDNQNFEAIGDVTNGEKANQFDVFQFVDRNARYGVNYYRLKQKDAKGNDSYSQVRMITFEIHPFSVKATPNPASEDLTITIQQAKSNGVVSLIDELGRERINSEFEKGQRKLKIPVAMLANGTYTLLVKSGEDSYTEKIVVIH